MSRVWMMVLAGAALALASCKTEVERRTATVGPVTEGARPPSRERVRMETSLGTVVVELDWEHAPLTVANFLSYVDRGAYDNTIFHRAMKDFVVQGGGYSPEFVELPADAPIRNEWRNGLKNTRGTIGMARDTAPDSATRQFYINVADNAKLDTARETTGDAGYAVFGRVVEGMDVIDRMRRLPVMTRRDAKGEELENVPVEPPVLVRMRRVGGR